MVYTFIVYIFLILAEYLLSCIMIEASHDLFLSLCGYRSRSGKRINCFPTAKDRFPHSKTEKYIVRSEFYELIMSSYIEPHYTERLDVSVSWMRVRTNLLSIFR